MRIFRLVPFRLDFRRPAIGAVLALAAFTWGISVSTLRADSNPGNDGAAIQILITPNFDRGIEIDTANVNLDLGAVGLGASTQTVRPATVTITGNVTNTELDLAAQIAGGWSFDNSQVWASTGTNLLGVWASFTSISTGSAPAQGDEYFRVGTSSGAKLTAAGPVFPATAVGVSGGTGLGRFETNEPAADMDSLTPGNRRHLWIYLQTPPLTSTVNEQQVQFTISVRHGP